ncbi:NADH dehydrogenase subunit 4 (mitochondrion) [Mya arenaria]|uniref:NADH-ubiquinone oxidoreductase chain 4 n=1 Tax=Mya arenaria TaxID=6604 RepID=A0A076JE71_MYAAR|nr:NADH dehydrogenase subunit 4 [Mya arenaria]AII72393.1 NADH dehydrogenase subunit 4 [Mya arenaria]
MMMVFVGSGFILGGGMSVFSLGLILFMGFISFSNYLSVAFVSGGVYMDQISYIMVLMTVMVSMASLVSSCKNLFLWEKGEKSGEKYKNGFETAVVGVAVSSSVMFLVSNVFFFFFFFEFSLLPTLWLILSWGFNPERLQAGVAMMLYTVCASVPMLVLLGHFYTWCYSAEYLVIKFSTFDGFSWFGEFQWVAWLWMMLGFLVKLPVFFFHTWLPKAHVEAPLAGSMLLAGVLLKLSIFGMMRLSDVFSMKSISVLSEFLLVFSAWGGVLTSCYCLCQSDIKALIAYSSIGHMSVCLMGVVSLYPLGWSGALCLGFAHGLCSPLLFSMAGSLYQWCRSQSMLLSKGLLLSYPSFALWWCLSCVLNSGLPPSLNFIGEVLSISSGAWTSLFLVLPGGMMCFLSGACCFYLYGSVCHGSASSMSTNVSNMSERYLSTGVFLSVFTFAGILGSDFFLL